MAYVAEIDDLHFRQQQLKTMSIHSEQQLKTTPIHIDVGHIPRSPEPSPKKTRSASLEPQSISVMERKHFFQNHPNQQQQHQQHQQYHLHKQHQQHLQQYHYSPHQFGPPPTLGTLSSKSGTFATKDGNGNRSTGNGNRSAGNGNRSAGNGNKCAGNKSGKSGKDYLDPASRASVPPSIHRASSSGNIQNSHPQISSKSTPRLNRPSRLKLYKDEDAEVHMVGRRGQVEVEAL